MNSAPSAEHSAEQPAEQWEIWPSRQQVEVPKHEQTHTRTPPLPFTIDAWILGEYYYDRQYLGHGNTKVCYWLTETLVLKLRDGYDQEPDLFRDLEETGVYPKVHGSAECKFGDQTWYAWILERAKPLNQILTENPAASNICITGTVRAMLIAHSNNHLISDNGLYNFGMVDDKVVIIDAGSRGYHEKIKRGIFNTMAMKSFWSKAKAFVHPETLEVYAKEWQKAGQDMETSLQSYETRWRQLRIDGLPMPVIDVGNSTTGKCPHVVSVMDTIDDEVLDWLTNTYLWDKVAHYGRSADGYTRKQDSKYTAAQKLENLISETHARRVIHCKSPAEDILNEDELKYLLET